MQDAFDPYHVWLGIALDEQPPHHYRLLGIRLFEANAEVIESAGDRQMLHLKTHQTGRRGALSQRLMNEVSAATVCLLNPEKKQEYDAQLRAQLATPPTPVPVRLPLAPAVTAVPVFPVFAVPSIPQFQPRPAISAVVVQTAAAPATPFPQLTTTSRQGAKPKPRRKVSVVPFIVMNVVLVGLTIYGVWYYLYADHSQVVGIKDATPQPLTPQTTSPSPPLLTVPPSPPIIGTASVGEWVDLLAWTEGVTWKPRGIDWNANLEAPPTKNGVTLKPTKYNRFPLPAIIEGDYEMEVEFTRPVGPEGVSVFFPIGDHNMHLEIGGHNGTVGGVHWIDGQWALKGNPTTRRGFKTKAQQKHRVLIRTRHDADMAGFNIDWDSGKDFIVWEGPYASLTNVCADDWKLTMIRHPWIGGWSNRVTFSKLQVRMISGQIRRDVITAAERGADRVNGLVRLVGEQAIAPAVGAAQFVVNQTPLDLNCERSWPLIQRNFAICQDFYGAHAPSRLKVTIPRTAKSFTTIGYNDISRTTNFIAYVDGKSVYNSGVTGFAVVGFDLPTASSLLELVVDPVGDANYDASYWCYPRFYSVSLDKVTDKIRQAGSNSLRFQVTDSTVGHGQMTHNQPIPSLLSVPLELRDTKWCDEFLFAHAKSGVTYAVPDGMARFTAIGYCPVSRQVKFEVWADSKRIYESPQVGIIPIDIRLPRGTKAIELNVNDLGDINSDHSMWCYPRLHAK